MTDLPDLVAFVRACLDEDERVARAACDEASDYRVLGSRLAEEHFVLWKPDRVLAEVAAQRAILDEHSPPPSPKEEGKGWLGCFTCIGYVGETEPCTTVRLLAQPFAGRPGWREEWAT